VRPGARRASSGREKQTRERDLLAARDPFGLIDDAADDFPFVARAEPLLFRLEELSAAGFAIGVTAGGVDGAGWQPAEDLGELVG
jgi:hypothetical protein